MKKILKSVFVIFVSLGLVTAATRAFFSDTETSVGNRFVAGAIDLKVDSEGHYNGMDCVENKWSDCTYEGEGSELLLNGSFENPDVTTPQNWQIFPDDTPGLEWTVEWESGETTYLGEARPAPALVEFHEGVVAGWTTPYGEQYSELDSDWFGPTDGLNGEPALVRIYQMIPTELGKKYVVSYAYSPRPDVLSAADNELKVRIDGVQVATHSQAGNGTTTSWTTFTKEFDGTGSPVKVEFAAGGTPNSLGVFLDNVSVKEMLRVCTPNPEYEGMSCDPNWELKDLTVTDQFFDFSDLKPGDFGENTISLHVYNNDAYMCMNTSNYTDLEVTPGVEPETEAGDSDNTPGALGELAQHLDFFAWYDDGDNVWESDEVKITNEPVAGNVFLNNWSYGLYTPGNVMPQSSTKYVGLAWCFGTMGGVDTFALTCDGADQSYNQAQTDQVLADIGFYVEQARNNEGFSCSSVNQVPQWNDEGTRTSGDASFVDDESRGNVLQLTTISDNDSRVRWNNDNLDHDLSTFTGVSYDSKQVSAIDLVNGNATMRLMIDLDGDLNTADVQEITYEPYYNIAAHNPLNAVSILSNVWQTWSTNMANGKFWANGGFLGSTPGGGAYATNFTLAQVLAAHPAAKVSGISLGMGTYNPGQVVLVDNLVVNGAPLSLEN